MPEDVLDESEVVELVSVSEETVLDVDETAQEVVVADEPVLLEVSPDQVVELVPPAGPGPKGDPGEQGPQGDTGNFDNKWRGAWDSGTAYLDGDLVGHAGSSWLATDDTVAGEEPGVSAKWDLVASEGEQGPEGPQGEQGLKGDKGDKGDPGEQGEPGFFWEGEWIAQAYPKDSVVHHETETWVALDATTSGDEPGASGLWELVAPRSEVVRHARRLNTGPGTSGGGDLAQDRTIAALLGAGLEFDMDRFIQVDKTINRTQYEYHYNEPAPDLNSPIGPVPDTVKERHVWVSIALNGGVGSSSSVDAQVETSPGSGVYENVGVRWRVAPGSMSQTASGSFAVPRGHRYRFQEDDTGGSRSIIQYGFRDEALVRSVVLDFASPGEHLFLVPDNVQDGEVTVEAWGAGVRGQDGGSSGARGGGAGAYSKQVVSVVAAQEYTARVGDTKDNTAEDSEFVHPDETVLVRAKGGTLQIGGAAADGLGTTKHDGGTADTGGSLSGGGGGGAAGTTEAGGDASGTTGGTGGSEEGGAGGTGATTTSQATEGSWPGGGGGGGARATDSIQASFSLGRAGSHGRVRITYTEEV